MDKSKKTIIIMVIILFISSIIVAIIIYDINKAKTEETEGINEYTQVEEIEVDTSIKEEVSPTKYYAIKHVIDQYYENMSKFNSNYNVIISGVVVEEETELEREDAMRALKEMMSNYINDINIKDDQLRQFFKRQSNETFDIEKLYYKNENEKIEVYYAKGKLIKSNEEGYIIIIIDKETNGYTILPLEYVKEKFGKDIDVSKIKLSEEMLTISTKSYNKISYNNVSDQDICMYYFGDYMNNLKADIKTVYDSLNEEYKNKKFENYDNFKTYIENNYKTLTNMTMTEYQIYKNTTDGTTMYLCKDGEGHCYIFNASAVMNYTLMLDSYTVDLPEFIEKYDKSSNEQKVALNVQKIIDATNDGDYNYVFNKLDQTFKTNEFQSELSFRNYMQETFANKDIEYDNCKNEGELYFLNVKIVDKNTNKANNKTFVMKLLDGTDFVMSFNVN